LQVDDYFVIPRVEKMYTLKKRKFQKRMILRARKNFEQKFV